MFTKHRELAGFVSHGGMVHMGCIDWDNKIYPIVFLKNRKLQRILSVRTSALRFK